MIYNKCNYWLIFALSLLFTSCSSTDISNNVNISTRLSKDDPHNIVYQGHYKIGKKYCIKNKCYSPREYNKYRKIGIASWYGGKDEPFHGKLTANGEIFNRNLLTCAHKTLPLPSIVKVTNIENNKSLILLVNDRGPFAGNREIDVSLKAAMILGMKKKGIAKVKVEYLPEMTKKFLKIIGLNSKHGAKTSKCLGKCSVNCYIKIFNILDKRI